MLTGTTLLNELKLSTMAVTLDDLYHRREYPKFCVNL